MIELTEQSEPAAVGDGVEYVHDLVRRAILRGTIPAGTAISQPQLSRDLGVSRTPLREALRMLQREGLIEGTKNRSLRVSPCSVDDAEDLYVTRVALEATAIRISIPTMTPERLAELGGYLAQMTHFADTDDYERWEVPHRAFHAALVAGAGRRTRTLLAQLSDHADRYRRQYSRDAPHARPASVAEHRAILDACIRGDRDAGAALLAEHLGSVAIGLIALEQPDYRPVALETAIRAASISLGSGTD